MEEKDKKEPVIITEEVKVRPLRKMAKEKFPDFMPENDEDWNEKEDEVFNEMEEYNRNYKDAEDKLDEIIATDPELAEVLNDMIVYKLPFRVAIARHFSQEDLIPVEGEEDFEAYQSAFRERLDNKKKRDERDAEIANNEQASLKAIDDFASEKAMDDEAKKSFIGFINDIFDSMLYKKLTPEMLDAFYKAMNHDADVENAANEAEIKGRNANIEAAMEEEAKQEEGDGIPEIDKGGNMEEPQDKVAPTAIDDILGKRKKF